MNTDDSTNEKTVIKLKSMPDENGDVQVFEISKGAAQISELVRDAAPEDDDDDDDGDGPSFEIDIARVKGPCLEKVVDFMKHHHIEKMKEIPTPLGGSSFNDASNCFV